jgi:dephospho-CoA kinase
MARMPDPNTPGPAAAAPFRPRTPRVIGLLGGVASGKSTVAGLFAAHGLRHIDADAHARALSNEPDVLAELAREFGPAIAGGGRLDRAALARIVFADPAARARLEAILLPRVRARVLAEVDAAVAAGDSVLLDAPLLLEHGLIDRCSAVAFVEADETLRRRRAAARGWDAGDLQRREAAQAPLAVKKARATHTIRNEGSLDATAAQVAAMLRELADRSS